MPTLTERAVRERLELCGIKRVFLAVQNDRLRQETAQALREARRLGSPTLTLTEAARVAGVSRSVAYSGYLGGQGGDDVADDGSTDDDDPAVA